MSRQSRSNRKGFDNCRNRVPLFFFCRKLTNLLHHFDPATCEVLFRKVHAALADGGRAVTLEFVPNEDRVSPPEAASFSVMMLISTPSGDAYTFSELERMAANAGFSRSTMHPLPPTIQQVVISEK